MPTFKLYLLGFTFIFTLACCSCGSQKSRNNILSYGDVDTSLIAKDTSLQANLDLSYEFQQTMTENDSIAYDFLAYNKPSLKDSTKWEAKYLLIRRAPGRQDTVAKGLRRFPVVKVWLCRLKENTGPQILFYEAPKLRLANGNKPLLYAFQTNSSKPALSICCQLSQENEHYRGEDTFFVYGKFLIRQYPVYAGKTANTPSGKIWQSYSLQSGSLKLIKEKME